MNDRLKIASRLLAVRYRHWSGSKDELQAALDAADALIALELQTRPPKERPGPTSAPALCAVCFGHADHAPTCPERPR